MNLRLILPLLISLPVNAIVIRHDVKDQDYLAAHKDFPPLATLYVDGGHGTLIRPSWVVTAAHATFCTAPGAKIAIANQRFIIKRRYVHPDYTPGKSHDIALLELSTPVTATLPAELATLPSKEKDHHWFIGIGGTGNGLTGQTTDNAQNEGQLRKAQNRVAGVQGPLVRYHFDKGEQALPLEGVSGAGDSGGPGFQYTQGKYVLFSISSRFEGGGIGKYGIDEYYTHVPYFQHWITDIIQDNGNARDNSLSQLRALPAGLTDDILPMVCEDIGIR